MKHGWIILGMFLLLLASVGILIYLLTQMAMSLPLALLLWALVFGVFALVGGIAWLAGWLPQKKTPEPKPQSAVIETPKPEPSHLTEEEIKTKPSQRPVKETTDRGPKIIDIEGIGPVYAEKLNSINIYTTSDLLEAGATLLGRKELTEKTWLTGKHYKPSHNPTQTANQKRRRPQQPRQCRNSVGNREVYNFQKSLSSCCIPLLHENVWHTLDTD